MHARCIYRYVTLDASSRNEMMSILMRLRGCTLGGQYVQARLKASAPAVLDPAAIPVIPCDLPILEDALPAPRRKRRNRKRRNRKNKKNETKGDSSKKDNKQRAAKQKAKTPISLGEDNFPTIPQDKQVEWEPDTMQKELDLTEYEESSSKSSVSKSSDAASTATTVSSSVDSCRKAFGGYAAALLKPSPTPVPSTKTVAPATKVPVTAKSTKATPLTQVSVESEPVAIVIQPPSWGQGRSFADIMRSC